MNTINLIDSKEIADKACALFMQRFEGKKAHILAEIGGIANYAFMRFDCEIRVRIFFGQAVICFVGKDSEIRISPESIIKMQEHPDRFWLHTDFGGLGLELHFNLLEDV
jgi:hypothetical protein